MTNEANPERDPAEPTVEQLVERIFDSLETYYLWMGRAICPEYDSLSPWEQVEVHRYGWESGDREDGCESA